MHFLVVSSKYLTAENSENAQDRKKGSIFLPRV
jgi:hypothetical protein